MQRGSTGTISYSDIYTLDNITQHVGALAGRNQLINILREYFSRDREYRFFTDIFGYPKTPSHIGLDPEAGLIDDETTRLFIGSSFRYDISYLPAIIVRQTGMSYKPVSFNQNKWVLEYEQHKIIDGYGNVTFVTSPSHYQFAGLWEQTFEIKILSKSLEDTTAIHDLVMLGLQHTYRDILQRNGLFIKSSRSSGESIESIGANDPLYTTSISLECMSEWRRRLPVNTLVDRIQLCLSFDSIPTDIPANNLSYHIKLE